MEARRSCSFQHYKQRPNEALESLKIRLGTLLRSSTMRNRGKTAFFSHYRERNTNGRAIYHVITQSGPLLISTRSKVLVRNQSHSAYLLWIKCMKCFILATLASVVSFTRIEMTGDDWEMIREKGRISVLSDLHSYVQSNKVNSLYESL